MRYRVIRTEGLSKVFGRQTAIRNLTLDVEPGEIYGFLGSAGAGKTTFARMLLDIVHPSAGSALVLEMDSRRNGLAIRRKTGYSPAVFSANPRLTGLALLRSLARLRGNVDPDEVLRLAEQFKADLDTPFGQLNAAGRQKIGLIQAFMHRPELLILDEPTRSLDAPAQETFFQLVQQNRADGRTVFITSSSLTEMERVCDRAAFIHRGALVAVERGVKLRSRALRHVEMRFAGPVSAEAFARLPNLKDLHLQDNTLSCTLFGNPDALIKAVSQFPVTNFVSQTPSLEEAFLQYYGVEQHAA